MSKDFPDPDDFLNDHFDKQDAKPVYRFSLPDSPAGQIFFNEYMYAGQIWKDGYEKQGSFFLNGLDALIAEQVRVLSALLGSYELLEKLAQKFNRTAETMVFPQVVYDYREAYGALIPMRTIDLGGTSSTWYAEARKKPKEARQDWHQFWKLAEDKLGEYYPTTSAVDDFVAAFYTVCQKSSELEEKLNGTELFAELYELNHALSSSAIAQHCQNIETALRQRIKGQPQAIRALVASEMKSFRRSSSKLRDIFTFAGPSGVGKTELAKAYAEALSESTDLGFSFRTFNMENYCDERSAMGLFGSGSQYVDSGYGELTRHATAFPRTVYLFDEIEKAHHSVIQSLLTVLDSGSAVDSTTQERVSFSQSVVIFTTNLGQREFNDSKGMGELNIFDVLEHAKTPYSSVSALTPELVNRLRAGTAVRFFPLHAAALYAISQASIERLQATASNALTFEYGPDMAALALFSNMPSPVPRAIATTLDSIATRSQNQLFQKLASEPTALDAIKKVRLTAAPSLYEAAHERLLITYIGKDSQLAEQLQQQMTPTQFHTVDVDGAQKDPLKLTSYALLLIDAREFYQDQLAGFITRLREIDTQLGLILLSPSSAQLRDEFIVDYTWLQLDHANLSGNIDDLLKLAKVTSILKLAEQKHLALKYDIELDKLSRTQATFIATDPKLTPQVSAKRASDGVPGLVTRRPSTRLYDVIGLHRAKQELARVIRWLEDPSQLRRYNLPMPTGVLLLGPPGTGKTLLARAVAGEVDLPFISLSIGEMLSSSVNGTATNLQKAFNAARDIAPCVMFIDEIDAIAGARGDGDRSHNAAVNTLLTQLDGLQKNAEPIFIIAATNRAESLDPALTRSGRLDHPILCDIPNSDDRRKFIEFYMKKHKLSFTDKEIEQFVIQTQGMSGADMEQVFITTLYNVASATSGQNSYAKVDAEAVREAITYMRFGAPVPHKGNEKGKHQTAAHEAGHLLVQKLLLPEQRITIATIEARNRSLGFISTQREENSGPQTLDEIKAQLAVFMAGREAEQMLHGEAGMNGGAASDLQQATRLALHAICGLGLDPEFGLVNYGNNFFDVASTDERRLASERLHLWLEEARQKARDVLTEHRNKLEFITDELFRKESVYQPDIEAWFE